MPREPFEPCDTDYGYGTSVIDDLHIHKHTHTHTYRLYCRPAVCLLIKKPIKKRKKKRNCKRKWKREAMKICTSITCSPGAHRLNYFPIYRSIFVVAVVVFYVVHNLLVISTLYPVWAQRGCTMKHARLMEMQSTFSSLSLYTHRVSKCWAWVIYFFCAHNYRIELFIFALSFMLAAFFC